MYNQIVLSMLDQKFHSEIAADPSFNLDESYFELESQHSLFPAHSKSRWYAQFGHLVSYSATYYSYLFDRAIANLVWDKIFKECPLSREGGEKFLREILVWGGSRNPWECVASALDMPDLVKGDERAMALIGQSLIKDES
jgi:intermediate peptidase